MSAGFDDRFIQSVAISDFAAIRDRDGEWACCKVTVTLSGPKPQVKGPEILIDVAADTSLEQPFLEVEKALLERAIAVMQRCIRETPETLHRRLIQSC